MLYYCNVHKVIVLFFRAHCLDVIVLIDVSSTGIISLPVIIFKLRHLVQLNASSNKLQALPKHETWDAPNLKEVVIIVNRYSI